MLFLKENKEFFQNKKKSPGRIYIYIYIYIYTNFTLSRDICTFFSLIYKMLKAIVGLFFPKIFKSSIFEG